MSSGTVRGFQPTCPRCGALSGRTAERCEDCGAILGLSAAKIEAVGAAAVSIQHAAGKVRDLVNREPSVQPRGERYVGLRDVLRALEDQRRRLLDLYS